MIASNKQRQEQNNLANLKSKTRGSPWAHEHSETLQLVLQPKSEPNKNRQRSHQGLLPYDNNERKCELNENNKSVVKNFFEP